MNWPSYPDYEESHIDWAGPTPADWRTAATKYFGAVALGKMLQSESRSEHDSFRPYLRAAHIQPTGLSFDAAEQSMWFSQTELRTLDLLADDVVVVEGGAGYGRSATLDSDLEGWGFQNSINRIRPISSNEGRFIDYCLRSALGSGYIEVVCGVATIPHLTAEKLSRERIPLPPPSTQRAVCDFLDRETAKIDALIGKQEQLIATLREDRAATITQAVTEGLDPRGGISSSGKQGAPPHWTRDVPLKRMAEVQTGLTLGRSVPPETAVTLPYLRVANVQVGRVNLTEVTEVEIDRSETKRYRLRSGDVLMTEGGDIDKLGRGCLWQGEIDPCLHQNHVFAVRCSRKLEARFLVYLLDTALAREYFTLTAKKTTNLASTNSTTLGRFSFPVPPIGEQKNIVKFLDESCYRIDTLVNKSTEMIETLREYRAALITNAVTGKIDVRKAV